MNWSVLLIDKSVGLFSCITCFQKYIHKLGVPDDFAFVDVYDLSSDGLKSVPQPVLAALLLFPRAKVATQIITLLLLHRCVSRCVLVILFDLFSFLSWVNFMFLSLILLTSIFNLWEFMKHGSLSTCGVSTVTFWRLCRNPFVRFFFYFHSQQR